MPVTFVVAKPCQLPKIVICACKASTANNNRYIVVSQQIKNLFRRELLEFHSFTGCDYNFFRKMKKRRLKILSNCKEYQIAFLDCVNMNCNRNITFRDLGKKEYRSECCTILIIFKELRNKKRERTLPKETTKYFDASN